MNSTIHKESQMTIAFEQMKDKLYHNSSAFLYLILLQMLGYLFSFNAGMNATGTEHFFLSIRSISPIPMHIFTIIWMLIQGLHLAGEKSREYYLVSNNFTAYFSDIAILEIYAVIGGFTVLLSGSLLQVLASLIHGNITLHYAFLEVGLLNHLSLFVTSTLYFLIFGAAAYTFGILRERFNVRFFLGASMTVVILIGIQILGVRTLGPGFGTNLVELVEFYLKETNLAFWLLKVIGTIAVLYGISYFGIRDLEVND